MISVDHLRDLFIDKLQRTGSFDAAFTKAVWVAFKEGYRIGTTVSKVEQMPPKWLDDGRVETEQQEN